MEFCRQSPGFSQLTASISRSDVWLCFRFRRCFPAEHMLTTQARACQPCHRRSSQSHLSADANRASDWSGSAKRRRRAARVAYRVVSGQTVNTAARWQRANGAGFFFFPLSCCLTGAEETTTAEPGSHFHHFKGLNKTFSHSDVFSFSRLFVPCNVSLSHPHKSDSCSGFTEEISFRSSRTQ